METITTGSLADVSAVDNDSSSTSVASRVVSPPGVPGDALDEQHMKLSRALFRNDIAAIRDNIPSQHLCPMVQEPSLVAVHFDLSNTDGTTTTPTSRQVFTHNRHYTGSLVPKVNFLLKRNSPSLILSPVYVLHEI